MRQATLVWTTWQALLQQFAWAYSNAPFVLALPFERTEAILEGMVAAFEFYAVVSPKSFTGSELLYHIVRGICRAEPAG